MMKEFTQALELTDEELDLVAAGGGGGGGCCGSRGDTNGNGSINVLSFDTVQVNAGILSVQSNSSDNA